MRNRPTRRRAGLAAAVYMVAYLLLDWSSHVEPQALLGISPWDPPAGLSVALLLAYGFTTMPAVAIASIGGELLMRALPVPPGYAIAAGLAMAAGYAGAVAVLQGKLRIDSRLGTLRDFGWLTIVVIVAALVVSVGFVGVYGLVDQKSLESGLRTAFHFWIGDVTGIMAVTPFLLVHAPRLRLGWAAWRPTPAMLVEGVTLGLSIWIVFGPVVTEDFRFFYLLFLPVIWIAMRHGMQGATMAVLAVQLGLILGVRYRGEAAGTVLELQLLMVSLAMTGLFLGMVVNERRGALSALNDRESELNRMLRLAGAGEMASALAHELNQPLSAVTVYLRALRAMAEAPAGRERQILETIDKSVKEAARAAEVVRRLREYFGTGVVRLEPCTAADLVRSAAEALHNRLNRQAIELQVDCPPSLPRVLADRLQIEIVLHNLLGNAIDAIGGKPGSRRITVSGAEDGRMLHIRVEDSGPGLSPEIEGRLFQPFATGKPRGMGLGLVISRSIVEAHRGKLWHEPAASGGAVFNLTLPIHELPGTIRP
ncbi:MAG TPA: ATP-binding protein [Burkholderiales bacterium]